MPDRPQPLTLPLLTPSCMVCKKRTTVQITDLEFSRLTEINPDTGRLRYLIQDALPDRDADFRELVKTGTHPECWTSMFGDDEDGDRDA